MTFDLTPELESRLLTAREWARGVLAPAAASIDRTGQIPADVQRRLDEFGVWDHGPLDAVVVLEELAAGCAAAAVRLVLASDDATALAGLPGTAMVTEPSDQQLLGLAAVCLGIGRAALDVAVGTARARGDRPSGEPSDAPHWVLADAATELDAARLLARATAAGAGIGPAGSLAFAGGAAARAVDAAIRIVGAEAWRPGSIIERCARDVRAALLLAGSEDVARRLAADRLLA